MHGYFFKKTQERQQRGGLFARAPSTGMVYFSYCNDYTTTRMQSLYKTNGSRILLCIYLLTFPHFGVLFGLNTGSSRDIQIPSLNEFLSLPLSNHPCNKFSSSVDLAINSEPWVLQNHILLFLSSSNFLFAVYSCHKLCLCSAALGLFALQMAYPLQRKWRKHSPLTVWAWLNDLLLSLDWKMT